MIPMHATATANPRQLRWVVPPERLPAGGIVGQAPGRLGALLAGGVIEEIVVRGADILITLDAARDWRAFGEEVRGALDEALGDPAGWRIDRAAEPGAELATVTEELLAGPVGELARSHGGSIELVAVDGLDVTVRMSGACRGCAAAGTTLHDALQRELRRRVDPRVTVSSEQEPSPLSIGKKLLSLLVR